MSDSPEWFAAKRYGYAAGLPISWQGWALTIGLIAIATVLAFAFGNRPLVFIAVMVPLTGIFLVIAARTTRGGWRWRWGKRD